MSAAEAHTPCPWCGVRNPPRYLICAECEGPLQPAEATWRGRTPPPEPPRREPETMRIRVWGVVVVLLVIGLLVALWAP